MRPVEARPRWDDEVDCGSLVRHRAVVYRGAGADPHCAHAAAELLRASPWDFDIRFVDDPRCVDDAMFDSIDLFVQPGGGELEDAFDSVARYRNTLRAFLRGGGRYVGFCLGGYLAGATPGFDLLPGDTDRYAGTRGAETNDDGETVVRVRWRGHERAMYFQDGPHFVLRAETAARFDGPDHVLARYRTGAIAALVVPFGRGRVAVCGPHPEADRSWFTGRRLSPVTNTDLGLDLLDEVMR